jgi:hypothetical protein
MNDDTQQRVVTALAAGMTFVLSRLVTQRFIKVPERRGVKDDVGRRPGSGPQGRYHRDLDRTGLGDRAAVASGTPVDSPERRLRKKRAGAPVGIPSTWRPHPDGAAYCDHSPFNPRQRALSGTLGSPGSAVISLRPPYSMTYTMPSLSTYSPLTAAVFSISARMAGTSR